MIDTQDYTGSRALQLPRGESFFLWGPRQTGKSTLLRATFPDAFWVDLLKADAFRRYTAQPELMRQELVLYPDGHTVVIDEIQKVPTLLDEVHWLMENRKMIFALCGSSARKVRRGHANLLGGRALRFELHGFTAGELGEHFDLARALNNGYLPRHYLVSKPKARIQAYIADYLREEIAAEGFVRNLPSFSTFLDTAALSDGEVVNCATIARDCGVASSTVADYFGILQDTLLGSWLPAYRKRPKRRTTQSPKFYFHDVGVVNVLAKRGAVELGSMVAGKAFENWVYHELLAQRCYGGDPYDLAYWRLSSGIEVDFIADGRVAIEAKATAKVTGDHLKGLRQFREEYPDVKALVIVCLEQRPRVTDDGIFICPSADFAKRVAAGLDFPQDNHRELFPPKYLKPAPNS